MSVYGSETINRAIALSEQIMMLYAFDYKAFEISPMLKLPRVVVAFVFSQGLKNPKLLKIYETQKAHIERYTNKKGRNDS